MKLKEKLRFIIALFINASMIPCFAELTLDNLDISEHTSRYNSLLSVEDADDTLKRYSCFPEFLAKAEEVVLSYGFEKHTGVRLMHRHFELPSDSVMVEEFQEVSGVSSLVTSTVPVTEARLKNAVPSGWVLNSSSIGIFEFSTDEAVRQGFRDIQTTPEFLEQMEKTIKDYNLENLMSVSLLKKDSLFATEGQYYQERTFSDKSVVQILDGDWGESTRTSWSFGKGPIMLRCSVCRKDDAWGHRELYYS
ncbi:MAG: hypothetical protein ACK4V2_04250 [Pseudomonadota bacterium]|jgi:hypothetical protein|nr:hypothetical protein [Alphaproteobacteria bacterium]